MLCPCQHAYGVALARCDFRSALVCEIEHLSDEMRGHAVARERRLLERPAQAHRRRLLARQARRRVRDDIDATTLREVRSERDEPLGLRARLAAGVVTDE